MASRTLRSVAVSSSPSETCLAISSPLAITGQTIETAIAVDDISGLIPNFAVTDVTQRTPISATVPRSNLRLPDVPAST